MDFRCISFHQANADIDLCRLAVDLGFNHVELQMENGQFRRLQKVDGDAAPSQQEGLRLSHDWLVETGKLKALQELGLRIVVWTREIEDYDADRDGPIALDNHKLFESLEQRYEAIFTEIFPELDAVALTVAETNTWVEDPAVIKRICDMVAEVCRRHGKRMILRTFAYEDQRAAVGRIARELPDDVWLMTKYNPRDWHIRGVRDSLIGNIDPTRETVEEDIGGEYHLANKTANCMVDAFRRRFAPLKRMGLRGLTLRSNRGWDINKNYQGTIYGEVQETHLWAYAAWMQEELEGEDAVVEPIRRWAAYTFGDDAPIDELVQVFRPTGEVMAEALYVGFEPFGDTRNPVPIVRTTGGNRIWREEPITIARRYSDAEAELNGDRAAVKPVMPWAWASAYHHARANHPHEPALLPHYHDLRRGHPDLIVAKTASLQAARRSIDASISRFETLKSSLAQEPWYYFRFKLEATRRELQFRSNAILAYMLGCQRVYSDDSARKDLLAKEISKHLAAIDAMAKDAAAATPQEQKHRGRAYQFLAWPEGMSAFTENLRAHFEL